MPLKISAHRHGNGRVSPLTAYREVLRERPSVASASWHRCHQVFLPVVFAAPQMARRVVRIRSVLYGVPHVCETAERCVSELVTNAVTHAQWPDDPSRRYIGLSVGVAGPYFLVTVSDLDPRLPKVGAPVDWESFRWTGEDGDADETIKQNSAPESGMGLFTVANQVAEVSGEFGFEPSKDGHGKVVYVALPMTDYSWVGDRR